MSRKQAICYLVILSVLILAALVLLGIFQVWLMLLAILLLVTAAGLLLRYKPQLFSALKKPPKQSAASLSPGGVPPHKTDYVPNLILVAGNLPSAGQITVNKPVFTMGRDAGCDFCITSAPDISRVHVTIRYDRKTAASYIVDNNSHNGTYVNGKKLAPGKPKRINNGDFIQLGTVRFTAQVAHY